MWDMQPFLYRTLNWTPPEDHIWVGAATGDTHEGGQTIEAAAPGDRLTGRRKTT
jgi:hypothetical protein